MKIWLKLYIGAIVGIFLGLYLPDASGELGGFFLYLAGLVVRIGRYVLLPLVFFSLVITVYELKLENKLFAVYWKTIVYAVLTSLGMIVLGTVLVSLFPPGRIPIIVEVNVPLEKPALKELLYRIFPTSLFTIFTESSDFLLPLIVFAIFMGLTLTHNRNLFHSVVETCDSLSRLFYHMNSFITEFLFIGAIALAASMLLQLRKAPEIGLFLKLFTVLGLFTLIIVFVIFPLLLYFLSGRKKPLDWMYAQLAPAAGAFLSGDVYFSLGLLMRHAKESVGIPRRICAAAPPLLAVFTRGGSAMIMAMSFIVVLRSHSNLEIGFSQILWIIAASFGLSFLLGAVPGFGAFVGLAMLSGMYGREMEEGFLILRPVSILLVSMGALLDTVCASFVTTLVSNSLRMTESGKKREMI
ncbi:MAG: cation:dicarboxylase symporter family transporter [Spirochaetales bacterium]|jgi:Na+/H+-dicarboxylate symporter|nr:cation:dicarboxylase symporter family transporter [Spirochaetales bacterium]